MSSGTSWSSSAWIATRSTPRLGEDLGGGDRVRDERFARGAWRVAVRLDREVDRPADIGHVGVGVVLEDGRDQLLRPSPCGESAFRGRAIVPGPCGRGSPGWAPSAPFGGAARVSLPRGRATGGISAGRSARVRWATIAEKSSSGFRPVRARRPHRARPPRAPASAVEYEPAQRLRRAAGRRARARGSRRAAGRRCHRHSRRPAASPSPAGAAACVARMAYAAAPSSWAAT